MYLTHPACIYALMPHLPPCAALMDLNGGMLNMHGGMLNMLHFPQCTEHVLYVYSAAPATPVRG